MEKEEFLKLLPKLIRENDEVKGAIISALSGVVATSEDIKILIKEFRKRFEAIDKRFEAMDKRFEAMDRRFEALQKQMNERFEAMDKRFEALQKQMNERFEAIDRRFEALQKQMNERFEAQYKEIQKVSVAIGALGRRSGKALENTILAILKDKLIQENIDASKITKEYLYDEKGEVFWKNYNSDIDILMQNGKIILIEIKYHVNKHKIERFVRKSQLFKLQFKKDFDALVMICLEIKSSVLHIAKQFGVKIIVGNILP
ncbi:MAG: DUF3782 domain-containing protein [Promethearchaeota archaeon]